MRRFLPLALVVLVLALAGFSPRAVPQVWVHQDKLHHVLGFFVLGWALRRGCPRLGLTGYLAIGLAMAGLIELGQGVLLPQRTASLGDVLASLFGLGMGRLWWLRRVASTEPEPIP